LNLSPAKILYLTNMLILPYAYLKEFCVKFLVRITNFKILIFLLKPDFELFQSSLDLFLMYVITIFALGV